MANKRVRTPRKTKYKVQLPPWMEKTWEVLKKIGAVFASIGKFENFPYPGVGEALQQLKDQGHRLFVATSKPEVMAKEVLEHFELSHYFDQIAGATLDGSRSHKADVITYLLSLTGDVGQTLMVGDTAFDVIGAAAHGIPTLGVSWGYGQVQDMLDAGAFAIAHTMEEMVELLNQ